jgi:hypothetical protein
MRVQEWLMSIEQARASLAVAKSQLEKVQIAANADDDNQDPENAVMWAFYAYENSLIALAEMHERDWAPNHYAKAQLARDLYADQLISRDIGDELEELNRLRKDVAYGELGDELEDKDLEMLASGLEEFIDEIQERMDALK